MSGRSLLVLASIALAACAEQRVPDALIDVWRTSTPGYEDRTLEVRADSVVFGTGGETTTGHPLTGVEVEVTRDGRLACTLHYALHGEGAAELRLMLDPRPPATLRLANRKEVWQRERESTWLAGRATE
jgi:hypothetical protein